MKKEYPVEKAYETADGLVSVYDLLSTFADAEMQVEGISRVSDLHIKEGEPLRFRVDGILQELDGGVSVTGEVFEQLVFPILSENNLQKWKEGKVNDIDCGYYWEDEGINFRINLFRERDGFACVIRMLPKFVPPLEEFAFMGEGIGERLCSLRQGLVLVTGVTSSGKTTTVASLLDAINNQRACRIITLEDPIEFVFKSKQALISQRELGTHIEDFGQGLRSALRENPDVIYVGEIRDKETAALALTAAETGHLVISTLHTKDVKGAFSRLVDMFEADRAEEVSSQLSFLTAAIISQKLAARKERAGRIPVFEVLLNDSALSHLIRSAKWHQIYGKLETSSKLGMNTLEQHLLKLVEENEISSEEAAHLANDPSIMSRLGL